MHREANALHEFADLCNGGSGCRESCVHPVIQPPTIHPHVHQALYSARQSIFGDGPVIWQDAAMIQGPEQGTGGYGTS